MPIMFATQHLKTVHQAAVLVKAHALRRDLNVRTNITTGDNIAVTIFQAT